MIPILLGIGLIWYSVSRLSPDDVEAIQNSFKTANYWWVLVSLILGVLSHVSRAYRWQYMLDPLGFRPRFGNKMMAVMISYLVNLILPRAGEFARATSIAKYEDVPFEKALGTIVSERVADMVMLLGITALAFFYQTELISSYFFKDDEGQGFWVYLILGGLGLGGLFVLWLIRKSQNPLIKKIQSFVFGLIQGVTSIFRMKKKWSFIAHTILIWTLYVLMFYVVTFAIPETTHMPFAAIIVCFVVGGVSMALTNGGLGTYPIFVAGALALYGIPENPALAFGWIMWTAQTVMVLVLGGASFLLLPLYNKGK